MPTLIKRSRRQSRNSLAVLSVVALVCLWLSRYITFSNESYFLSLHTVSEVLALAAHFAIFTIGLLTFRYTQKTHILIISLAALAVGLIDLGHTLSYAGITASFSTTRGGVSTYLWIAARFSEGVSLMLVAQALKRNWKWTYPSRLGAALALGWASICYFVILIVGIELPMSLSSSAGLGLIKTIFEVINMLLALGAGLIIYREKIKEESLSQLWLAQSCFVFVLSGLFFLSSQNLSESSIIAGHIFKVIAVGYLYRAMLYDCVTHPFAQVQKSAIRESHHSDSKSRFIATIGHELRTPLGVISGYSDILQMSGRLDDESREWVGTIKKSSEQIRLLINDLLDLSKAENNKLSIVKKQINFKNLLEETFEEIKVLADKKGLSLKFDFLQTLSPVIVTDPLRFKQIVVNLLSNAIKFTQAGSVTLRCSSRKSNELLISVIDTGIGIAEDKRHMLFKSYSQIENNETRSKEGTGLGLALSRKLAELLGAELYLESSEPTKGSVFTLRFPINPDLTKEQREVFVNEGPASVTPKFAGVHVLVVDDAKENLFIVEQYLQDTQAIITLVEDPLQAIEFVRKHMDSIDVIFLDIMMPQMDGYEVCANVRSLGFSGPVIALSAHSQINMVAADKRFHFDSHLLKPINKEALWTSVRKAVLNYH